MYPKFVPDEIAIEEMMNIIYKEYFNFPENKFQHGLEEEISIVSCVI